MGVIVGLVGTLLVLAAVVAWGLHEIRRVDRTIAEIGARRPDRGDDQDEPVEGSS